MSVKTMLVHPDVLRETIRSTGTVLAEEEVELRSEIAGKVASINFEEGSRAKKGDLLVKINDADLQAQLLKLESQVKIAQEGEERQRALLDKSLTSREVYDQSLNALNVVKADIALVRANIAKTEIRAPFDGTVGLRSVSVGSYVSSNTKIASLQSLQRVKVDFTVPERYGSLIRNGEEVSFTTQGSSRVYTALVYAVEPKIDAATRTVQIRATAPNPNAEIRAGAFASVELTLLIDKTALLIPTESIVPILKGFQVYIVRNGAAEVRQIEIGTRNERTVHVTRGLESGDTLVTSGILQLSQGTKVRVTEVQ